jgi:hypothetical protein
VSKLRGSSKELRDLLKAIEDQGGSVVQCRRSSHYKVYLEGRCIATISGTPSDHRARKNILGDLRRGGLDLS